MSKLITFRFPDVLLEKMQIAAEAEGRKLSDWVKRQLHRAIDSEARQGAEFSALMKELKTALTRVETESADTDRTLKGLNRIIEFQARTYLMVLAAYRDAKGENEAVSRHTHVKTMAPEFLKTGALKMKDL